MTAREPAPGLDNSFSLTFKDACKCVGWSRNRMYAEVGAERVRSYLMGSRRFIITASLRDRVDELATISPPIAPLDLARQVGPEHEPRPRRLRRAAVSKGSTEVNGGTRIRR